MPDARAVARKSATHLAKRCCSSAAASGAAGVGAGAGAVAGPAPAVEPGGCDAGPGGAEAQPATSAAMAAATRAGLMVDCRNEVLLAGCISGFSPVRHGGKPFSRADAPLSYSRGGRAGEHGPPAAANSRGSHLKGTVMPHQTYAACIEACNGCATACHHCAASCLKEPDVQMMARCIALDMDCAAACQFAAAAMARGSEHAKAICALCAGICETCGEECARHRHEHCQACAKACRDCAAACRAMAH